MKLTVPLAPDDTRHVAVTAPDDLTPTEMARACNVLRTWALGKDARSRLEPQGLGAVVHGIGYNARRISFVRTANPNSPWFSEDGEWYSWPEIEDAYLLTGGLQ